jgi:HSP20 family molecular chaperone IbpA
MMRNNDYDLNDLFDDMVCNWGVRNSTYPAVNVYENPNAFVLEASLPGYTSKDVDIKIDKHVLHLTSEMKEKKDDRKYIVRERHSVKFDRAFSLPEGINEEAIEAQFKNGLLTITLPKLPVEQPRRIEVKVTD